MAIGREMWRFFDPALGVPEPDLFREASPDEQNSTALYQISREVNDGREEFRVLNAFGYLDRSSKLAVVAPHDLPYGEALADLAEAELEDLPESAFASDFASVPDILTWLVPKTGAHLPAALTHDAMIGRPFYLVVAADDDEPADVVTGFRPTNVIWCPGDPDPPFTAVDADRIFRDAMADSGTGVIRRWLIWSAVTIRTMLARDGTAPSAWLRWYYAVIAFVTIATIVVLGYQATAQLFERTGDWPCTFELPWIRNELPWGLDGAPLVGDGFGARLTTGGVWALVLPLPFGALFWGRFRAAGMIAGVALAFLVHITVAVVVLSAAYVVAEAIATGGLRGLRDLGVRVARRWYVVAAVAAVAAAMVIWC